MKVPFQHVPSASMSPISASPPSADSNAIAFASAMQCLMQCAASEKAPSPPIIPDVPGDHAKQQMVSEPGIRRSLSWKPTQELSSSIQTAAAGVVISSPEGSSPSESEIMEPVATPAGGIGPLPPPAAIHALRLLPIAMQEPSDDTHVGKSEPATISSDRIRDSAGHPTTREKSCDTTRQDQVSKNSDPRGLTLVGPDAMLPIPVLPVAVEPPAPGKTVSTEATPAKLNKSVLPGRSSHLQTPLLNPTSPATAVTASGEPPETIGKPTLPICSKPLTPSSDLASASGLGHSEKDIAGPGTWSPKAVLDADTATPVPVPAGKQPAHPRSVHAEENGDPAGRMTPGHIGQDTPRAEPSQSKAEAIRIELAPPGTNTNAHLHIPAANPAPQIHEPGTIGDQHRPQEIASQVLERMDSAAPADSTQLHVDKRRLEVGVAAGALGWVEVRATTGISGRVDATLHVQSDTSAHILAAQSSQIASFASQHSIQLGELSVNVGAGNSNRRRDPQPSETATPEQGRVRESENASVTAYHTTDRIGLINLRA
jgi:hypothetical protein